VNEHSKKAVLGLLSQIKSTVLTLEDIILNSSFEDKIISFDEERKPAKRAAPSTDLDDNEENFLQQTLEKERLAIIESDKILKDLWEQGRQKNAN
jgi:hypothetical protein